MKRNGRDLYKTAVRRWVILTRRLFQHAVCHCRDEITLSCLSGISGTFELQSRSRLHQLLLITFRHYARNSRCISSVSRRECSALSKLVHVRALPRMFGALGWRTGSACHDLINKKKFFPAFAVVVHTMFLSLRPFETQCPSFQPFTCRLDGLKSLAGFLPGIPVSSPWLFVRQTL